MKQNNIKPGVNQEEYALIFKLNEEEAKTKSSLFSRIFEKFAQHNLSMLFTSNNNKIFNDIIERETKHTK